MFLHAFEYVKQLQTYNSRLGLRMRLRLRNEDQAEDGDKAKDEAGDEAKDEAGDEVEDVEMACASLTYSSKQKC